MTNVTYEVTTPKGSVEVKTLARAEEIVEEKGGTFKAKYSEVPTPAPQISATKLEWLKSSKKPMYPYRAY